MSPADAETLENPKPEPQDSELAQPRLRRIKFIIFGLTAAIVLGGLGLMFVLTGLRTVRVPSGAMIPTYQIGDILAVNLHVYRFSNPSIEDTIVFYPPGHALHEDVENVQFISRVVGVPGDVVEIKDGDFYRNGQVAEDSFAKFLMPNSQDMRSYREANDEERATHQRDFRLVHFNGELWPLSIYNESVNSEFGRTATRFIPASPDEERQLLSLEAAAIPSGHYLVMGDNRFNSYDGRSWGLVKREWIVGRVDRVLSRGN